MSESNIYFFFVCYKFIKIESYIIFLFVRMGYNINKYYENIMWGNN